MRMRVLHFNARHCQGHNGLRSEQQYRVTDSSERRYPFFKVSTRADYIFYIYNLGFPLSVTFFCVTALLLVTCSRAASRHLIGPLEAARDAARIL
ncbi:hypothetical protein NDU88_005857 [Pleurodeles waltl]|uniref:Uncharacterized protein n=1 Tax=Pleurodeles waltl TaxID=8319 RepID=A0AAV7TBS7_PLEWA|nr:hypothetical protein NDU88_005857 [Pleurodeles waltl]